MKSLALLILLKEIVSVLCLSLDILVCVEKRCGFWKLSHEKAIKIESAGWKS